jgi:RNA polymerase sigma-70 factor (ECF subfamily)
VTSTPRLPADDSALKDSQPINPDLISRARSGDARALGDLLQGCREYLLLIANRDLGNDLQRKVAPSDLVQETMADALRDFGDFRGDTESQLLAWMRQILVNNMAGTVERFRNTAKRDISREQEAESALSNQRLAALLVDPQPTPSTDLLATEARVQLIAALAQLPEHYRRVISLRNMELLTFVEIGERLECSADSARKLWDRAIRRLSRELESNDEIARRTPRDAAANAGGADMAGGPV